MCEQVWDASLLISMLVLRRLICWRIMARGESRLIGRIFESCADNLWVQVRIIQALVGIE